MCRTPSYPGNDAISAHHLVFSGSLGLAERARLSVIILIETCDHRADERGPSFISKSLIFPVIAAVLMGTRTLMTLIQGVHFSHFSVQSFSAHFLITKVDRRIFCRRICEIKSV